MIGLHLIGGVDQAEDEDCVVEALVAGELVAGFEEADVELWLVAEVGGLGDDGDVGHGLIEVFGFEVGLEASGGGHCAVVGCGGVGELVLKIGEAFLVVALVEVGLCEVLVEFLYFGLVEL